VLLSQLLSSEQKNQKQLPVSDKAFIFARVNTLYLFVYLNLFTVENTLKTGGLELLKARLSKNKVILPLLYLSCNEFLYRAQCRSFFVKPVRKQKRMSI
jgi:hypothetical protein